jgi:hypothetical protein
VLVVECLIVPQLGDAIDVVLGLACRANSFPITS